MTTRLCCLLPEGGVRVLLRSTPEQEPKKSIDGYLVGVQMVNIISTLELEKHPWERPAPTPGLYVDFAEFGQP